MCFLTYAVNSMKCQCDTGQNRFSQKCGNWLIEKVYLLHVVVFRFALHGNKINTWFVSIDEFRILETRFFIDIFL